MRLIPSLLLLIAWLSFPAHGAEVVRVVDGDTFVLNDYKRIRLYGIDCPELDQPLGTAAAELTRELTMTQSVTVVAHYLDRYGRTVATIYLEDGRCVQEELLLSGLAWVDTRYCRADICVEWLQLEDEARKHCTGLWGEPKAIAPWEWRKGKR